MAFPMIEVDGKRFAVVGEDVLNRLLAKAGRVEESELPPLPEADEHGNFPAVAYLRASIARDVVRRRMAAGWSQAEFARRSGVRVETLNRIEKARTTASTATIEKIERALELAEPRKASIDAGRRKSRRPRRVATKA